MKSGPSPEAGPSREPEPPGEFVSEELRTDCARFLDELRALLRIRHERPRERAGWVPPHDRGSHRD